MGRPAGQVAAASCILIQPHQVIQKVYLLGTQNWQRRSIVESVALEVCTCRL